MSLVHRVMDPVINRPERLRKNNKTEKQTTWSQCRRQRTDVGSWRPLQITIILFNRSTVSRNKQMKNEQSERWRTVTDNTCSQLHGRSLSAAAGSGVT